MCADYVELTQHAQTIGWFGYIEGQRPEDVVVYQCHCGDHVSLIVHDSDDPDYYVHRCSFMDTCVAA